MNYQDILEFWFSAEAQPNWFAKSAEFDAIIRKNFAGLLRSASQAELWRWRNCAEGRLAEIIVLDQFSRNLHRASADAFAQDALALALAQEAISLKLDLRLRPEQRAFLYMPFMHSESPLVHQYALKLFEGLGNPLNLEFEKTNNDTAPYDDIFTKITNVIEDALGESETGMRAATDKK